MSAWRRVVVLLTALSLTGCAGGSAGGAGRPSSAASTASSTTTAPATDAPSTVADTDATTATTAPATNTSPTVASSTPVGVPAAITQPAQPTSGPGGNDHRHADWRISEGGSGADAWYVFEPIAPQPATAPLAVVMHGYFEYSGYDSMYELIRHTVLQGSIVVYPRWQTDVAEPCPGPVDIEPCLAAAANGIRGALAFLQADPGRVQPDLSRTSAFGFSFGGIITADLANRHAELDLPLPRAIFFDDPHDGGLVGFDEPALDDSLAGIPSATLIVCHSGAEGVIAEPDKAGASCNSLFPKLDHVPAENKALVMTRPDAHGEPALSSAHGVCSARPGGADAYDWNFCWTTWDALRRAADDGTERDAALGDTLRQRDNGVWSDGVPIAPPVVADVAPLRP